MEWLYSCMESWIFSLSRTLNLLLKCSSCMYTARWIFTYTCLCLYAHPEGFTMPLCCQSPASETTIQISFACCWTSFKGNDIELHVLFCVCCSQLLVISTRVTVLLNAAVIHFFHCYINLSDEQLGFVGILLITFIIISTKYLLLVSNLVVKY